MAALEAAVTMPDCAREGCGHSHGRHRKTRNKKQLILKCAEPGCTCRHYLEPNEDGTPRRTSPTAGQKYPAEILTPDEIAAMIEPVLERIAHQPARLALDRRDFDRREGGLYLDFDRHWRRFGVDRRPH